MSIPVPHPPCYLVEWYRPAVTADLDDIVTKLDDSVASLSTAGSPVQLLMALAVPIDEVVFGVFAADSADMVAQACQRAGIPAERLTAAVHFGRSLSDRRETPDLSLGATPLASVHRS
jgi:hypothetical protein